MKCDGTQMFCNHTLIALHEEGATDKALHEFKKHMEANPQLILVRTEVIENGRIRASFAKDGQGHA